MSEAWFGLLGVVVGGLISTVWSWLSVVRQELSEGMVAARLVDDELRGLDPSARGVGPVDALSDEMWRQYRVALAMVLGERQWNAVADAYRLAAEPTSAESLPRAVATARSALQPLVQGKRYIVSQRWRNAVATLWRKRAQ